MESSAGAMLEAGKDPIQETLKLKQTAIDTWNVKEQLALAMAVLQSGNQVLERFKYVKAGLICFKSLKIFYSVSILFKLVFISVRF